MAVNPGLDFHFKALEAYHVKCLQAILGVRWWRKVTHSDLRRRAKVQSMECMVMQRQLRLVGSECHQTVCLDTFFTLSFRKAVAHVVARWNVFRPRQATAGECQISSRHSPLIDLCGVTSVEMVLPHSLSTTIRKQKLAGATPFPRRRQPDHVATSVTKSVRPISDCAVTYSSTIVRRQLASTASSSTFDGLLQASKSKKPSQYNESRMCDQPGSCRTRRAAARSID